MKQIIELRRNRIAECEAKGNVFHLPNIDREDVKVYDEYGEEQDKDEFFKDALEWTTQKNWKTGEIKEAYDSATYEAYTPDERHYLLDNEYTRMLEREGFKFASKTHSDFYSDGLRFASFTDFS
jgi:hypothetical protein